MSGNVYGYMRVSTQEQTEERQRIALKAHGVPEESLLLDKLSGKDFNRPSYQALLNILKPGDTLVIDSLDRLGRNYFAIMDEWHKLTRQKRINMVVLDSPTLTIKSTDDELFNAFLSDMMLGLSSYMAHKERENLHVRQAAGIAAAQARGVKFGRRKLEKPPGYRMICHKYKEGLITCSEAARQLGVPRSTLADWLKKSCEKDARRHRK